MDLSSSLSKYDTKWSKVANQGRSLCPYTFVAHYNELIASFIEYIEEEQPNKKHKNNMNSKVEVPMEELIGSFQNISIVVPKVNCKKFYVYNTYIKLELKSSNIDILYNNIKKLLILPLDKSYFSISITLYNSIYMGKAAYENIIFTLKPNERLDSFILNPELFKGENEIKNKLTLIKDTSIGVEVLAKLFSAFCKLKIELPNVIASDKKNKFFNCRIRANTGFLFLFDSGMFFYPSPSMFLQIEDMQSLKIIPSGNKFIELKIKLSTQDKEICFEGIETSEQNIIQTWINNNKSKMNKSRAESPSTIEPLKSEVAEPVRMEDDDSEDDSEFEPEDESDPDEEYDSEIEQVEYDPNVEENKEDEDVDEEEGGGEDGDDNENGEEEEEDGDEEENNEIVKPEMIDIKEESLEKSESLLKREEIVQLLSSGPEPGNSIYEDDIIEIN